MEDIFLEEVNEKKAAARNYRYKTNGRRSLKKMLSFEHMTAQQRKEYTKGGKIKMSNIYDEILTKADYENLTDDKKKTALNYWRKNKSNIEIKKAFGWNDYKLYKELDRLGVEYDKRKPKQNKKAPAKKKKKKEDQQQPSAWNEIAASALEVLPAQNTGTSFFVDDIFTTEEAVAKLMKFATFLEGEPHNVKIRLEIKEVKK